VTITENSVNEVRSFSKGPKRVGDSLPSPEDGNRFSPRNFVFSSYLEYRTMEKCHKRSESDVIRHRQNSLESTYYHELPFLIVRKCFNCNSVIILSIEE
jgi:hypothetical protein